jgi:hypothetical protein
MGKKKRYFSMYYYGSIIMTISKNRANKPRGKKERNKGEQCQYMK